MSNIFITGVAGLIGSNLARYYIDKGWNVYGVDSLVGGYKSNVPDKVSWWKTDILNHEELVSNMKFAKPDVVVHAAAIAAEGLSVFSPKCITENIFSGTVSVASAAIVNNVELFINMSSMARFGNNPNPPFKEISVCKPCDPYGLAKLQAEQQLNLLSDIYNIKVVHVVPHSVVGAGQVYTDSFRNVAAIMANRLLLNKSIYIYGDGEQKRSFSHISDCINAIAAIIKNPPNSKEVYNIGPMDNEISINELAKLLGRLCNTLPIIEYLPDRPQEVKNAYCSNEKIINDYGYKITMSTEDTLRDIVSFIRQRGPDPIFRYNLPIEIINEQTPKTWVNKLF